MIITISKLFHSIIFLRIPFFKKHLRKAASVILMAALLTKHLIVPTFKKTGVNFRSKFR